MLNENKNNSLSIKNSDELPRRDAAVSTEGSSKLDDGQASTRSTYDSFFWLFAYTQMFTRRLFKDLLISLVGYVYTGQIVPNHIVNLISVQKSLRAERESQTVTYTRENETGFLPGRISSVRNFFSAYKRYLLCSEDDIGLQCPSKKGFEFKDREPMFVIVDSSCISNPSSLELLIDKTVKKGSVLKKHFNRKVIPIGIPSTSTGLGENIIQQQLQDSESADELEMIEINLQSENEIPIEKDEMDNESIVISYLQNKELNLDKEELSESSLDAHIPSYPGSPRSLSFTIASSTSLQSSDPSNNRASNVEEYTDVKLKETVDYLHAEDDFLSAAEMGDYFMLELLLSQGVNIHRLDHLGRNALHLAVCSESASSIILLLQAGVNPNVKDNVGMTPLSLCLMRSPSMRIANLLFDHGARILPRTNVMDTGLFLQFVIMCIPTPEEELILRLLVEKGGKVNDPDAPGGRQALHFAAMSNNCNLIRLLMSLGANLYETNHRGQTPREFASAFNCKEAYALLEELELESDRSTTSGKSTD